ncbi:MAG: 4Fe-4S dicluster domain-containing protein [Thermoanaerobaculales bacterium]|jgi:reductive dehalogenase|nr:4Fe-4S dicluster domain-containing protein [Thermoanaerobaculales bacterium]
MKELATVIPVVMGLVATLALIAFTVVSWREGEGRAARVFAVAALAAGALLVAAPVLVPSAVPVVNGLLAIAVAAIAVRCLLPLRRPVAGAGRPSRRVDERDIMFARKRLRPGSVEFDAYYELRPENRAGDDRTRSLPGLLSRDAEKAEPVAFAAADAAFEITEALRDSVNGPVAERRCGRSAGELTALLKRTALDWGAVDVGVAALEPEQIYTHVGRGTGVWGSEIELDHGSAIAFTVEMDHRAVAWAPEAPVVAESARQYVEAAKIAIQLAAMIRELGWPARAHIDGNYRVIAPLVARAAGLGEIGRMGLLMTPMLGPRVRIGVVTTECPLVPDTPSDDTTVLDFCSICRKCAVSCPVGAIPLGDRSEETDGRRWIIDDETCFRYWNVVGTDCATCMKVCPYSHPDNWMHNLVRRALQISPGTRSLMLRADDLVYGRKP